MSSAGEVNKKNGGMGISSTEPICLNWRKIPSWTGVLTEEPRADRVGADVKKKVICNR